MPERTANTNRDHGRDERFSIKEQWTGKFPEVSGSRCAFSGKLFNSPPSREKVKPRLPGRKRERSEGQNTHGRSISSYRMEKRQRPLKKKTMGTTSTSWVREILGEGNVRSRREVNEGIFVDMIGRYALSLLLS